MQPRLSTKLTMGFLVGLTCLPVASVGQETLEAQLVVYLEVAETSELDRVVTLGRCDLRGEGRTIELDPSTSSLDAGAMVGRQVRWVEQRLPAGYYDRLSLEIEGVEGTIGRAQVRPDVPDGPIDLPLDLHLHARQSTLLIMRWEPRPIDPEADVHTPRLVFETPQPPPPGSVAFVSNEGSGNISVIDRFTGRLVAVLATGDRPRGLAYSELGQWLYVASAGSNEIVAFDVLSLRRVKQAFLPFGSEPSRIVVDDFHAAAYVLNYGSELLSILDPRSLQEVNQISVGRGPRGLALDPETGRVYVSLEMEGVVRVYDPLQHALVAPLGAGTSPGEILFARESSNLYIASGTQRRVSEFNTVTGSGTPGLTLCSAARGLAYSPISRRLYVSQAGCRSVAVLQSERELDVGSIRLPGTPGLIALDPDYRQLLVTLPETDQVIVYNVNSRNVQGSVEVGDRPYAVLVP